MAPERKDSMSVLAKPEGRVSQALSTQAARI